MSNWSREYLVAGLRVEVSSSAGDPTPLLPPALDLFAPTRPGSPDIRVEFRQDDGAQADPLRRFFPAVFFLERDGAGLSFRGREGGRRHLGTIHEGCTAAEMGVPALQRPWRIEEEGEAVREAMQAFLKACLQCRLLREGGTMMHASGVEWEGGGYAFSGHTRSGKTTISRDFPAGAVLGDDLVAVRRSGKEFSLFGTPWPGREGGIVSYGGVPLRAVFCLHPELGPGITPLRPAEALAELAANAPRLGHEGEESKLLGVFSSLAETVPIYILSLRLGDDVVPFLRRA